MDCEEVGMPASQSMQAGAASSAAEPAEQFLQTVRDVAATIAEAEPRLQFEHSAEVPIWASV